MSEKNEAEMPGETEQYYEQTRKKWQTIKGQILEEEAKYTNLKEHFISYIEKEKELMVYMRTADDICRRTEDMEQDGNAEEIFKAFEVSD